MGARYEEDVTLVASETFVGKQYFIATKSGQTACALAGGATENLIGIIQEPVTSGRPCRIRRGGKSLLVVDATTDIAVGDRLTSDSAGKGVKTTTDGNVVIAIAAQAATEDGQIIEVDMVRFDAYVA